MHPRTILTGSAAALLFAFLPCGARAAENTLNGVSPAWGTATNWSLGALPTAADNVIILGTVTVDIRGSTLGGFAEVQDLTFSTPAAMTLINNSTGSDMTLALNGTRGAGVPLISTTGNFTYTVTGTNTAATPRLLTFQLRTSGSIDVAGTGRLDLNAFLTESGGSFALTKTGTGILSLGSANTFTGGVTINEGTLEIFNATGAGSGPVVANPGTRVLLRGLTMANPVTLNGAELATRGNNLSNYNGPVTVAADSTVVLRSFTTPANDQNLTIGGLLSGSAGLAINGNASNAVSATALILTNPANTYSGTFTVNAAQTLRSAPATTGNTLGTALVRLSGGTLDLRDDGTGSNGTISYATPVIIEGTGGAFNVDRTVANTNNTFELGAVTLNAPTLTVSGANNYALRLNNLTVSTAPTFNITTSTLTLGSALGGAISVTKTGVGVLVLEGANTHTGPTLVQGGTLRLVGSLAGTPRVELSGGGTFDVTTAAGGFTLLGTQTLAGAGTVLGTLTTASGARIEAGDAGGNGSITLAGLVLGTAPAHTATLRVSRNATPGTIVVNTPDGLNVGSGPGTVTVNVVGETPAIGQHVLIDYNGTLGGTGFGGFVLGTLPTQRVIASLVHNTAGTSIDLDVTGTDFPVWTGALSDEWSLAALGTPKNWLLNTNQTPTDFLTSDTVLFNDSATTTNVVLNVGPVAPALITFNNSAKNYTVSGTQPITGPAAFTKTGTGTVTISNVNNFTGAVNLDGGTVSVNALADSGQPSALGAGGTINFNGGTLEYTGPTGSTNRPITLNVGGGALRPTSTLTIAGIISGTGPLTKSGSGTLVLTGANTHADTTISAGTVQVGDGGTLGTGIVANNAALVFDHAGALNIAATLTGSGTVTKLGAGDLTLSGAGINDYTGTTVITAGALIAGKAAGTNAIGGDLFIENGAAFRYVGNNVSNQIRDTASVTLNGGIFGDPANTGPTSPGATDTIANLTINGGTFGSGRNVTIGAFTITGLLRVNAGTALAQRGGIIFAQSAEISGGSVNLDGGSTTGGQESRLDVGAGGLSLIGGTINFNSGPTAIGTSAQGSIVLLQGDLTSTGVSQFVRQNAGVVGPKARVDLGGIGRTFNVTGTFNVGTPGATVDIGNGGVTKTGPGNLVLSGVNDYLGDTIIDAGTLTLTGSLTGTTRIEVKSGTVFDVSGIAGGLSTGGTQTLTGAGQIVGGVTAFGTVAPGPNIATLEFSDRLTLAGTTDFGINKTGLLRTADLAEVAGTLTYGGLLRVTATGDAIENGDVFNLFDAPIFAGVFGTFELPSLSGGLSWSTDNLPLDGTLIVIPEPSSAALLLAGLGGLLRRRRR